MNLSRVIVGVHWPFDILGGLVTGVSSAYFVRYVLTKNKFVKTVNTFIIKILHYTILCVFYCL